MTTTGAVLLPGGDVVVPAELLAALLHELELARAPLSVRIPPRSAAVAALVDLTRQGAIAHRQQQRALRAIASIPSHQSTSAPLPASAPVGDLSEGEAGAVGVAEAAEILDCSHQMVRVLCGNGGLVARKRRYSHNGSPARIQWEIDADSCHAYRRQTAGTVWSRPMKAGNE